MNQAKNTLAIIALVLVIAVLGMTVRFCVVATQIAVETREVTEQVTIDDLRQVLDIAEIESNAKLTKLILELDSRAD